MWSKAFWKACVERVIWTGAETAVAALTVGGVLAKEGILGVDWLPVLSITAGAMLLSLLKCVASHGATGTGPSSASTIEVLGPYEPYSPPPSYPDVG